MSLHFSGNYAGALEYALRTLPVYEELHDNKNEALTNIQISVCYRSLEDYDQALRCAKLANEIFPFYRRGLTKLDSNRASVVLTVLESVYEAKH